MGEQAMFHCVRCGSVLPLTYAADGTTCCWCDGLDRGVVARPAIELNRRLGPAYREPQPAAVVGEGE